MFVRGEKIDIGGEDAQERIVKGFQVLVDKVYVNLPMLRGVTYSEADISKAAMPESNLFAGVDGDQDLVEEQKEVLNYVQLQTKNGLRVSVKHIVDRFGQKPYGWPSAAVLCLIASLSGKDRVGARSDSMVLECAELAKALNNSRELANILLTPQVEFTSAQIRNARKFYEDMFDLPLEETDARKIGSEWAKSVDELSEELARLMKQSEKYPFMAALEPLALKIDAIKGKHINWYVTELSGQEEDLIDAKEEVLDKIRGFMARAQRKIYDDVRDFLQTHEANISYSDDGMVGEKLSRALNDSECYKGSFIQDLKPDFCMLKDLVELAVIEERKAATEVVEACAAKVSQTPEFQSLSADGQNLIRCEVERRKDDLGNVTMIPVLRDRANGWKRNLLRDILGEIERLKCSSEDSASTLGQPPREPIGATFINVMEIEVNYFKPYLTDEVDVEKYLDEVKKKLLEQIRANKKVIV